MSRKLNTKEVIEQFKKIHGNKYNYDKVEYKDNTTKVTITCSKHGDFEQSPNSHKKGRGCKLCANRKLVYGIGINDSDYYINPIIDGKRVICPYYTKWHSMMTRCYDPKYHIEKPTYIDCTVDKEWHSFMSFRKWMMSQDWVNKHLDKDLLFPGNKIYSKDTCCFVDENINTLLLDCGASRGSYPIGVSLRKSTGKYIAQISDSGKKKYLGDFYTFEEANKEYRLAKSKLVLRDSKDINDKSIKEALIRKALELLN